MEGKERDMEMIWSQRQFDKPFRDFVHFRFYFILFIFLSGG